jgi:hypothetical protein
LGHLTPTPIPAFALDGSASLTTGLAIGSVDLGRAKLRLLETDDTSVIFHLE